MRPVVITTVSVDLHVYLRYNSSLWYSEDNLCMTMMNQKRSKPSNLIFFYMKTKTENCAPFNYYCNHPHQILRCYFSEPLKPTPNISV